MLCINKKFRASTVQLNPMEITTLFYLVLYAHYSKWPRQRVWSKGQEELNDRLSWPDPSLLGLSATVGIELVNVIITQNQKYFQKQDLSKGSLKPHMYV